MNQSFDHISDDLLVKYLLAETTDEENQLVEAWINSNAANKKQYEDFKTIWVQSKRLAIISTVDEKAAWQRFKARIGQSTETAVVKKMEPRNWWRIAALFIIVAGTAYFGIKLFQAKPIREIAVASHNFVMTDTLPDGSVATLNKNSELDYPSRFKGDTRTITLKGEAFFKVTPDKKKPFLIHVNDVTIRVVGTSFNVRSVNDITEVIVETGFVQVIRNHKMVELRPNEKVTITQKDPVLVKDKVEDKLYNYYRSKQFVCDNTPLWKFVKVLNEAYDANIVIGNPRLRSLRLTAPFDNESLDRILEIIHETFDITVTKEKDSIILR